MTGALGLQEPMEIPTPPESWECRQIVMNVWKVETAGMSSGGQTSQTRMDGLRFCPVTKNDVHEEF